LAPRGALNARHTSRRQTVQIALRAPSVSFIAAGAYETKISSASQCPVWSYQRPRVCCSRPTGPQPSRSVRPQYCGAPVIRVGSGRSRRTGSQEFQRCGHKRACALTWPVSATRRGCKDNRDRLGLALQCRCSGSGYRDKHVWARLHQLVRE
jgi:hypothetical protein